MKTVVFFTNEYARIVIGRVRKGQFNIERTEALPIPAGIYINGVIVDEDLFSIFLAELAAMLPKNPAVTLVLDNSSIHTRVARMPRLNANNAYSFIRNEFLDRNIDESQYRYDYTVLRRGLPSEGDIVLSCAVEIALIERYKKVFESANIKLACIDLALNCLIKIFDFARGLEKSNSLVCLLLDDSLMVMSYSGDVYSFSNKNRIISPQGADGHRQEVVSRIIEYMEFQRSQNREYRVDQIYLLGMGDSFEQYAELLAQIGLIQGKILGSEALEGLINIDDDYLYNMGGLLNRG